MKKKEKWLFIAGSVITMAITLLSSSFIFISAAFHRGSLISHVETDILSKEEILKLENEVTSTGNIALVHIILTAAIILLCIISLVLLKRRFNPKRFIFIGIVISCLAIVQVIIIKDMVIFLILSLPGLILGVSMIITGFNKQRHLTSEGVIKALKDEN